MTREEQEDALEAAKLAAFVGSQLNAVDQMYTDRSNIPANRININNFVAKVKNPNVNIQPANYLTNIPRGFAAPLSEDQIRQMVPDHVSIKPPQINNSSIPEPINNVIVNQQPIIEQPVIQQGISINQNQLDEKLKNIENNVEKIGNLLESLLELVHNKLSQNE
jgi:hypothetical protein